MNVVKKRKLNPKIIRLYDLVKIENCMFFERCGYPLCVADLTDQIFERRKKEIIDLIRLEFPHYFNNNNLFLINSSESKVTELAQKIANKMATEQIVEKKYGSSDREIYEKSIPDLKNEEFVVIDMNFVKTGTRQPGQMISYYDGDTDYEPYFDQDKTYKILTLTYKDFDQEKRLEFLNIKKEDLKIQVNNVIKLSSNYYNYNDTRLFKRKK